MFCRSGSEEISPPGGGLISLFVRLFIQGTMFVGFLGYCNQGRYFMREQKYLLILLLTAFRIFSAFLEPDSSSCMVLLPWW